MDGLTLSFHYLLVLCLFTIQWRMTSLGLSTRNIVSVGYSNLEYTTSRLVLCSPLSRAVGDNPYSGSHLPPAQLTGGITILDKKHFRPKIKAMLHTTISILKDKLAIEKPTTISPRIRQSSTKPHVHHNTQKHSPHPFNRHTYSNFFSPSLLLSPHQTRGQVFSTKRLAGLGTEAWGKEEKTTHTPPLPLTSHQVSHKYVCTSTCLHPTSTE